MAEEEEELENKSPRRHDLRYMPISALASRYDDDDDSDV